jgi:CubicO group peptidase (beta-lactamase class C family)
LSIAEAFQAGLAEPLGLRDHSTAAVTYIAEPGLSRHRAAMFRMSARDIARFGELYLNRGEVDGKRILPADWIDRIASDYTETGMLGLRQGHGYLWWVPGPESGLPSGSFWAWGFGQQALFVIPAWQTVIVHQSEVAAFLKRFLDLVEEEGLNPDATFEKLALSCLEPAPAQTAYCMNDRFILPREFSELIKLIAAARL